jgi:hypothetical protein
MTSSVERQVSDWYELYVEPGVRKLVRLLRDNGVNTECSCEGHGDGAVPYVQCQYIPDGEIVRIHNLLFDHGYENFIIQLHHRVLDGKSFSTLDIYVGKNVEEMLRCWGALEKETDDRLLH